MDLQPGTRLRSTVCDTEIIVVRPPSGDVRLTCGGADLVPYGSDVTVGAVGPAAGLDGGTQLGKRYTSETDGTLEVLVTRPGAGTLADADTPLVLKQARALPSSD